MSIDVLAKRFNKPRDEVQLDYLAAYRQFKLVDKLTPKVAYHSAYASVFNSYFLELQRNIYKELGK